MTRAPRSYRMPTIRPFSKRIGYNALRVICRLFGTLGFGIRVVGREHAPADGPAVWCSNHQSHFDPMIVGLCYDGRLNYLARRTLFEKVPLRYFLEYFDSIPIDREGPALGGIKETLKRLKRGEQVLVFPEGTRTRDGEIAPLKPGVTTIAKRSKGPVIPVAMDGAYQAWPRTRPWPWFNRIAVVIGEPITAREVEQLSDENLLAELERRMRACHAQARKIRLSHSV